MNARRIFVYIVVISILVALGFLIKIFIYDPMMEDKDTDDESDDTEEIPEEEIKDCFFLNTDIINKRVYNKDGDRIKTTDFSVPCKKCKNFTYVDKDGCSSYMTDSRYTANGSQKVCTSLEYPTTCDSKFPQKSSSNDNGSPEPSNLP